MHNHIYPAGTEPHPQQGQPRRQEEQQEAPELFLPEELKRSGLTAVCASFVLDFVPNHKPGDARDNFLRWLTAIDAQLEKEHMHRVLNLKDLQAAHDHGQPTIVQTVEGAQFIEGRLDRQDDLVSLLGDVITSHASWWADGFWSKSREGVQPVGDLGGPCSRQSRDCARRVEGGHAASIVSHTGLDSRTGGNPRMAEMMKPHLISKERAKVVVFAENIKAMVDAAGIDTSGSAPTQICSPRVLAKAPTRLGRAWVLHIRS